MMESAVVPDFVQITFREAGAKRSRTIWAERGSVMADGKLTFWRVDRHGERPDTEEVIIGAEDRFAVRPAQMNLRYAELELVDAVVQQNSPA